ncbi:MAG: prenyltransferase [Leptolinea sp.]|nr:prenyltransferase [Leptolinea sp.]
MIDGSTAGQSVPQMKAIRFIKYLLFSASIIPCMLAACMAQAAGKFRMDWFLLVTFAIFIAQVGGDYLYYYFTHYHTDQRDAHTKIFAGWKPLFTDTLLRPEQTVFAGAACLLLGLLIGLYFYVQLGNTVLILAAVGGAIAVFFTPLMLRGLKEPVIFVTFGPLIVLGVYFVLTRRLALEPVLASLPGAFLVTLVAYLKSARFEVQELESGKVILNVSVTAIRWLAGLAYVTLVILIISRHLPVWSLMALATMPFAYLIQKRMKRQQRIEDYLWATVYSLIVYVATGLLISSGFVI